jgi:hypothetical protein
VEAQALPLRYARGHANAEPIRLLKSVSSAAESIEDKREKPPFNFVFTRQRVQNTEPRKSVLGTPIDRKIEIKNGKEIKQRMLRTEQKDEDRRQLLDARRMHQSKLLTNRSGNPLKEISAGRTWDDRLQWVGGRPVW